MRPPRWVVIIAGLLAGLLAVGLWQLRASSRRASERELLLAYARGPLSERLYVDSRAWPAWQGIKVSQRERVALQADCAQRAELGVVELQRLLSTAPPSNLRELLAQLLPGQLRYQQLQRELFAVRQGSAGQQEGLARARQERLALAEAVEGLRTYALTHLKLAGQDLLELNALLYSLKEPMD